jgi:protein-S-isoprenylcysteine O-methyltransferase Ste14
LAVRVSAARVLGAHYTRTLRTDGEQAVVSDRPNRYVRHPGYAGVLVMWLGYGLAWTSERCPRTASYAGSLSPRQEMGVSAVAVVIGWLAVDGQRRTG